MWEGVALDKFGGGADNFFQPLSVTLNQANVPVSPQRSIHTRFQAHGGKFGFVFVIVDVVIADHPFFRCLAGLTSTQDKPDHMVIPCFTHPAHQLKTSLGGFHYHVYNGNRNRVMGISN